MRCSLEDQQQVVCTRSLCVAASLPSQAAACSTVVVDYGAGIRGIYCQCVAAPIYSCWETRNIYGFAWNAVMSVFNNNSVGVVDLHAIAKGVGHGGELRFADDT